MKKLLLSLTLMFGSFASFAQLTCATATPILGNETVTVPQITGTYLGSCVGGPSINPNAMWYVYTAPGNGEVTIDSNLTVNVAPFSVDTRLSIITGTCTALECYSGDDDVSGTNYLTTLTFPVASGAIYYIVWDDRYSDLGFQFTLAFNAVPCIRPNDFGVLAPTAITNNSANLSWTASIGAPASYDVEYGALDFVQGTGTPVNTLTTSTTISSPSTPGGDLDYYLRSSCSTVNKSAWIGPYRIFLAKTLPYSNGFEGVAPTTNTDGFRASNWILDNDAIYAQTGTWYYYTSSSTSEASDKSLFTRAISLQANEQVTLKFWTKLDFATVPMQLKVLVNTTLSTTGATQLGSTLTLSSTTYAEQTFTFNSGSNPGTYYFIFNNVTPITASVNFLNFDTVSLTSVLNVNDFLSSKFAVYPNPVNNIINFSNDANAVVSSVEMADLNGRVVKTVKVNATEGQISVSDLATGMYMMKITTDQGVAIKKIVKQ